MLYQLKRLPKMKDRGLMSIGEVATTKDGEATIVPTINHLLHIDETDVLLEIFGGEAIGLYIAETSKNTPEINLLLGDRTPISSRQQALQDHLAR